VNFICSLCLVFLAGCTNSYKKNYLKLEMIAPQQAVLLTVKNDATLFYAGGINAIKGKNTWQGEMNLKQQIRYESLLNATRWKTDAPMSNTNIGSGQYRIKIQDAGVANTFTISLTDENATELYDFLQEVAISRLDKYLRSLPQPNADVIINRTKQE